VLRHSHKTGNAASDSPSTLTLVKGAVRPSPVKSLEVQQGVKGATRSEPKQAAPLGE